MAKTYKVLLVEDNDDLRRLYKEGFRHHNFEVYEAINGEAAIDIALSKSPDIVILDLMLPRQGGIGVLRIMRSLPDLRTIPVIVLTALNDPHYKDLATGKAQGYYLKTQIKPVELIGQARKIIDEKRRRLD